MNDLLTLRSLLSERRIPYSERRRPRGRRIVTLVRAPEPYEDGLAAQRGELTFDSAGALVAVSVSTTWKAQ